MSSNTLAHLLNPSNPSDDAIIIPDGPTISYSQYADEIKRVAGILAGAGVMPGRPVSIILPNSSQKHPDIFSESGFDNYQPQIASKSTGVTSGTDV